MSSLHPLPTCVWSPPFHHFSDSSPAHLAPPHGSSSGTGRPGQKPCLRRPEGSWKLGLPFSRHSLACIEMGMNKLFQLPPLLWSSFTFLPSEHLLAMWGVILFSYLSHALAARLASPTFSHMETNSPQLLWLLVVGPHPPVIEIPGDTYCLILLMLTVSFWFCYLPALLLFTYNWRVPETVWLPPSSFSWSYQKHAL